MTINTKAAKPGDKITIVGYINRRGKSKTNGSQTRMLYEPTTLDGEVLGLDMWVADKYGDNQTGVTHNDANKLNKTNLVVGDLVEITGEVYEYWKGKTRCIGVCNLVEDMIKLVKPTNPAIVEKMNKDIPEDAIREANSVERFSDPKPYIMKDGNVGVVGTKKERERLVRSLYR